jgi:tetratricopeptide (TPR) repeat protein
MRGRRPDEPLAAREDVAPISLVTADGVELELLSVEARALLVEPLAFTELHLRFRNPEARTLEGRFRVVLPPSAAVARFAMKVRDRWEEAELVELAQAHQAYEMFLHRRQDPALLEHSAGNEFSARVFPIAAHEEKELVLGYSEELVQPDEPHRIALKGIRTSARAEITLIRRGAQGLERRTFVVPTARDFEQPLVGGNVLLRHRDLTVERVTIPGTTIPAPIRPLAILFDTSASRALGLVRQVALLRNVLAEARRQSAEFDVQVLAFDQEVDTIYEGPASAFGDAQERMLLERGALGASHLEKALRTLGSHLAKRPAERVLIIGDGVTTAGALDGASLSRLAATLAAGGVKRLDAIVVGGVQDEASLSWLTDAGLPTSGVVLNGRRPAAWLWSRLTRQIATGDVRRAARAFGSIIDLFPARADLRRFAAGRLASLQNGSALELAIDSAWRAVEQRPDHPSGHHLAATLLLEASRFEQAFAVLTQALQRDFDNRYLEARRILGEDAALVAEAWVRAQPARADELRRRLARLGAPVEDGPSLRFVLT